MKLSVIIPCYNEYANLKNGVLDEVQRYLESVSFEWEVIIVDDASTDGSFEFLETFVADANGFSAVTIPHGGKPFAVRRGIELATLDYILFTDMDQSTPLSEFEKLRPAIESGVEVVIGSRGGTRDGFSAFRQSASAIFRGARRAVLLREISDTQCGFKAFRRDVAARLFPELSVFETQNNEGWTVSAFDVELLCMAQRQGYRIEEVYVLWSDRDMSTTKFDHNFRVKFLFESFDMAKQIATVKRKALRGDYD